jgi:hypothetical protein
MEGASFIGGTEGLVMAGSNFVSMNRSFRAVGWCSIAGGVFGIIAFGSLIAYLTTQADVFMRTGVMPAAGAILLDIGVAAAVLQAFCMIPVAVVLHALSRSHSPKVSRAAVIVVIAALCVVALLRVLPRLIQLYRTFFSSARRASLAFG